MEPLSIDVKRTLASNPLPGLEGACVTTRSDHAGTPRELVRPGRQGGTNAVPRRSYAAGSNSQATESTAFLACGSAARGSIPFSQLSLKSAQTPRGPALPPGSGE
jgi:hypothetical protein